MYEGPIKISLEDDEQTRIGSLCLDEYCSFCHGSGKTSNNKTCSDCNGTGFRLTYEGKDLLAFLKRHLGIEQTKEAK